MSSQEALSMADEANIDLVEIAPTAEPPVCRLMDYGKFKYNEQKKERRSKAKAEANSDQRDQVSSWHRRG
jgi:translation initiation factor IF-3